MKKVLVLVVAFIMAFQVAAFAADVIVTDKSTSGAAVSITGVQEATAVGIWADYDSEGNMIAYKPADITFANGAATASYTGSFVNLKFMLVKDLDNIMPLCDAEDIVLDGVIFEQEEGIEDLGDVEG